MTDHFPLASAVESTRILSLGAVDMHELELWRYGKLSLLYSLYGDTFTHAQMSWRETGHGTQLELYG